MRKGFGLYSTHETTIFFLKALLMSFWIGIDMIASLVIFSFPVSVLVQHGALVIAAMAILISGTIFSVMFTWATGSLFGKPAVHTDVGAIRIAIHELKRQPYYLIAAGSISAVVLLVLAVSCFNGLQRQSELVKQTGRADFAIAKKCAEVAALEKQLFHSDEQFVLTQCLLQYDQSFAAAGTAAQRKQ